MVRVVDEEVQYVECPHCHKRLAYTDSDVVETKRGNIIDCPKCIEAIFVEGYKPPFIYPDTFVDFNKGKAIDKDYVQKMIEELKKNILAGAFCEYSCIATGNTIVWGTKWEDDRVEINVAQGYYNDECDISELTSN